MRQRELKNAAQRVLSHDRIKKNCRMQSRRAACASGKRINAAIQRVAGQPRRISALKRSPIG
jgi:hypothetical protein